MRKLRNFYLVVILVLASNSALAEDSYINPFAHTHVEKAVAVLVGRSSDDDGKLYNATRITDRAFVSKLANEIRSTKAVHISYGAFDFFAVVIVDKDDQPLAALLYVFPARPSGFMPCQIAKKGSDFFIQYPGHYMGYGIPNEGFPQLVSKYVDIWKIPLQEPRHG